MQKIARIIPAIKHFFKKIVHNPKENIGPIISFTFGLAALVVAIGTYTINFYPPSRFIISLPLMVVTGIGYGCVTFAITVILGCLTVASLDLNGCLPSKFKVELWIYGTALLYCVAATWLGTLFWVGAAAAISATIVEVTLLTASICHDDPTARKYASRVLGVLFGYKSAV